MLFNLKIKIIVLLSLFFFTHSFAYNVHIGQAKNKVKNGAKIEVTKRALKNKILLRWAVNEALEWSKANKYGFVVERSTIGLLDTATKIYINFLDKPNYQSKIFTIKIKDSAEWNTAIQKAAQKNDYLIAAQALFGKTFEIETNERKSFAAIINKVKQLEQRFTYALMMADKNFEIAQLSGYGFEDTTIQPNEKYLYKIYSQAPKNEVELDTSYLIVGAMDYYPLPTVLDITSKFGDKQVLLAFDNSFLSSIYNAYYIERSEDSVEFKSITETPLVQMKSDHSKNDYFIYTDTLPLNHKTYYYRIRGISNFGEMGDPSLIIQGQGKSILKYVPNIRDVIVNKNNQAQIKWYIDPEAFNELSHFQLYYGNSIDSCKLVIDSIDKSKHSINIELEFLSNYFYIYAFSKSGAFRKSLSHYTQLVDSIPPQTPTTLKGFIDTHFVAHLSWSPNQEKDLLGYVVLKSNFKNEESVVLQNIPISDTFYSDTLNKILNQPSVFYGLIALDKRMNQSKNSTQIELVKPDKIAPSAPLKKSISAIQNRIVEIQFAPSFSVDLDYHLIRRKVLNLPNENWQTLSLLYKRERMTPMIIFRDTISSGYVPKLDLEYEIIAVDKSSNKTKNENPILITLPSIEISQFQFLTFEANPNYSKKTIELTWTVDHPSQIESIEIFKAKDDEPFVLWQSVKDDFQNNVSDSLIIREHIYRYGIRAILKNGNYSIFKEIKKWYD